jgi:hypothetical protein
MIMKRIILTFVLCIYSILSFAQVEEPRKVVEIDYAASFEKVEADIKGKLITQNKLQKGYWLSINPRMDGKILESHIDTHTVVVVQYSIGLEGVGAGVRSYWVLYDVLVKKILYNSYINTLVVGELGIDKIEDNIIYATKYEYVQGDATCCPSKKTSIVFEYVNGKMYVKI